MTTIAPCLWFDDDAEEAAAFYTDLLPGSTVKTTTQYPEGFDNPSELPRGSAMTVECELAGTPFTLLNGGPQFTPNPSISFILNFDPSRDPDARGSLEATWEALLPEGEVRMPLDKYPFSELYGWVEDRFGINWQLMVTDPEGDERPFLVPSLMFVGDVAGRAEEAIELYTSVFPDARRGIEARYPPGMEPEQEGTLMFADFQIAGQWLAAMDSANPGHAFGFDEGVSLQVLCEDQAEVDRYWEALTADGGEESMCGWLKDEFGVSWQIVPEGFFEMRTEPEGYERAFQAMLEMKKLDVAALEAAYKGEDV